MTMKKKILTTLSVVLILGLAALGILAYLQSEDSDVNVMTLGNVQIDQIEQEWNEEGTKLQDFTQEKPLYPYVGSFGWAKKGVDGGAYRTFTMENVVDKYVSVKNTGESPAYVRTFIALEMGSFGYNEFNKVGISNNAYNGAEFKFEGAWDWNYDGVMEIEGKKYNVMVAVHRDPVAAGETTIPSLNQVYLSKDATNEDVEKLDGNGNGTYDILALSQAVQVEGFADAATALNTAFGDPNNGYNPWAGKKIKWPGAADEWDGTTDTTWYNPADPKSEYVITTAEQLAGLAELVDDGNTFEGKTIYLDGDMDLGDKVFEPIGSYRKNTPFKGTFDGQGKTIKNLSQNTWNLDNGYAYGDLGLGLFGKVEDATIKDLNMDGASISGESAICGIVAATAYGDCTFENITVKNSECADYQYYAGGIVGWASGDHIYKNCTVDETTTIAAQWGDFDNSTGGVIGGAGGSATILLKDCNVACRIDAYNDVTSSYQWYAYRRCGMLIGNPGKTVVVDGTTYAAAPQLTCENVTVTYGDWANYTYCEFAGTSWPYVRVQAGVSNSAYSNPRYGHPTDANGNQVVDDTHVHNDGEDHQILCAFDQLYGGGQGVYGDPTHDGVTVVYNNK